MSDNLISIIIPTYNGESYIADTLESVLSSLYGNFEIICVDDFSTDSTIKIINHYINLDKRIKLISLKKKGGNPSKSIVFALPFCKGNYFFYMSQDDLISENLLENCLNMALKYDADIVIPNMIWYYGKKDTTKGIFPIKKFNNTVLSGKQSFIELWKYKLHGFSLKKMEIVKKYPYNDDFIDSTDICTAFQYYFAKKIVVCDGFFYYRQNNVNAITKNINVKFLEMLNSRIELINFAVKHDFTKTELKYVSKSFVILLKMIYKMSSDECLKNTIFLDKLSKYKKIFRKIMLYNCQLLMFFLSFCLMIRLKRFFISKQNKYKRINNV